MIKNNLKNIVSLCLICVVCFLISGCQAGNPDQSKIPWSRPQNWEGQVPGVPGTN